MLLVSKRNRLLTTDRGEKKWNWLLIWLSCLIFHFRNENKLFWLRRTVVPECASVSTTSFDGFRCLTSDGSQRERNFRFFGQIPILFADKVAEAVVRNKRRSCFRNSFAKLESHILVGPTIVRQRQHFDENKQCHYKLFICMTNHTHFGRCYSPSLARHDNNRTSSRTDQIF